LSGEASLGLDLFDSFCIKTKRTEKQKRITFKLLQLAHNTNKKVMVAGPA
jgi:hypothetical protein